ncbi:hypothetical protein IVB38_15245 [Bradyrhizobium sp. 38]|uniref:hypothetical protein n=1 Tax=unclassified Bradyrhizobium TaxID=2631580 RepID=UPI001FFAF2E6|nr:MULTISPECIES: hypothetical protein [unclassified Bradyrhizobium]MCK1337348.1 hypothetical protein [Bradyrhizobium sp. 38]MCK1778642.1 hypothetical protein [Bradyrhizobium sp. 132]
MNDDFKNLVTGLYDLLVPITDTELRKRAVKSALMMLGEDASFVERRSTGGVSGGGATADHHDSEDHGPLNAKARTWMRQNKVSEDQLGDVFHVDGEAVDIIAHTIPGESLSDRVVNTYVLIGLRELIRAGEPKFDDETARAECERFGTHGKTNHARYAKSGGNLLAGSAKNGWTLTAPGLKAGAELVKKLASSE